MNGTMQVLWNTGNATDGERGWLQRTYDFCAAEIGKGMQFLQSSTATTDLVELQIDNKTVLLEPSFVEYLRIEAAADGITLADAYQQELDAAAEIDSILPSADQLRQMSKRLPPDAFSQY